ATNIIIYNNITNTKSKHPLDFKFKNGNIIKPIVQLENEIQSSTPALFLMDAIREKKLLFNEEEILKCNFEDGLFCYEYLINHSPFSIAYISTAIYIYRKGLSDSTTAKSLLDKNLYLGIPNTIFSKLF
ncbi:hypothetical protein V6H78_001531, partial [Campylobacter lari]